VLCMLAYSRVIVARFVLMPITITGRTTSSRAIVHCQDSTLFSQLFVNSCISSAQSGLVFSVFKLLGAFFVVCVHDDGLVTAMCELLLHGRLGVGIVLTTLAVAESRFSATRFILDIYITKHRCFYLRASCTLTLM